MSCVASCVWPWWNVFSCPGHVWFPRFLLLRELFHTTGDLLCCFWSVCGQYYTREPPRGQNIRLKDAPLFNFGRVIIFWMWTLPPPAAPRGCPNRWFFLFCSEWEKGANKETMALWASLWGFGRVYVVRAGKQTCQVNHWNSFPRLRQWVFTSQTVDSLHCGDGVLQVLQHLQQVLVKTSRWLLKHVKTDANIEVFQTVWVGRWLLSLPSNLVTKPSTLFPLRKQCEWHVVWRGKDGFVTCFTTGNFPTNQLYRIYVMQLEKNGRHRTFDFPTYAI